MKCHVCLTWRPPPLGSAAATRVAAFRPGRLLGGEVYAIATTAPHDGKGDLPDNHHWAPAVSPRTRGPPSARPGQVRAAERLRHGPGCRTHLLRRGESWRAADKPVVSTCPAERKIQQICAWPASTGSGAAVPRWCFSRSSRRSAATPLDSAPLLPGPLDDGREVVLDRLFAYYPRRTRLPLGYGRFPARRRPRCSSTALPRRLGSTLNASDLVAATRPPDWSSPRRHHTLVECFQVYGAWRRHLGDMLTVTGIALNAARSWTTGTAKVRRWATSAAK